MGDPKVSVCVPSFNKERFVEATLDSIRCQTYQDFELFIVDDCSTDNSVRIIEEWIAKHGFPCQFIKHAANHGLCSTLNEVLAIARGRYFAGLAADDVWYPTFLETYVKRMDLLPDSVAALYGDMEEIDETGNLTRPWSEARHRLFERPPEGQIFRFLIRSNFIPAPAAFLRTACIRAVGGWDENLYLEDQDMWWRLADGYSFAFLPECLVQYRQNSGSVFRTRSGHLRVSQSQTALERKWTGVDPALDRFFDDRLCSWERVEGLYAGEDPTALRHAMRGFEKAPTARGLVMLVCILLRAPHSVFSKIDGFGMAVRSLLRGAFRTVR